MLSNSTKMHRSVFNAVFNASTSADSGRSTLSPALNMACMPSTFLIFCFIMTKMVDFNKIDRPPKQISSPHPPDSSSSEQLV